MATTLIGTFEVATAQPAAAFCSIYDPCSGGGGDPDPGPDPCGWWCYPDPFPDPDPGTGGGEPGGGGGDPGDAHTGHPGYDKAKSLLDNPTCRSLIDGNNTQLYGWDAQSILENVPFITETSPHPSDPTGHDVFAASPTGAGVEGYIRFYPAYSTATGATIYSLLASGAHLSRELTTEEVQAVITLHEDAHLTGANTHTSGDAGTFNLWILNQCLNITVTF